MLSFIDEVTCGIEVHQTRSRRIASPFRACGCVSKVLASLQANDWENGKGFLGASGALSCNATFLFCAKTESTNNLTKSMLLYVASYKAIIRRFYQSVKACSTHVETTK